MKPKIYLVQGCYRCGRDMSRNIEKGTRAYREFVEDHGPDELKGRLRKVKDGQFLLTLPDTLCDSC